MQLLDGIVQNYAWGDLDAIAQLQGRTPDGQPEAELWFGAHPSAPSRIVGGTEAPPAGGAAITLLDAVVADPEHVLGPAVVEGFGRFPFLLKVLAAAAPLSIQAHPSAAQAAVGFDREERQGIPTDAPNRVYRDSNHKPELICALGDFEAKCGFRRPDETARLLAAIAGAAGERSEALIPLLDLLDRSAEDGADRHDPLAAALAWLLRLGADDAAVVVDAAVDGATRLLAEPHDRDVNRYRPDLEWTAKLAASFPGDASVVVALLLNHLTLRSGDAVYLGAGNLHAYLRGVGVELMANSDNVVRGGFTPKHIDVDELLTVVDTTPVSPPIERASELGDHRFAVPVPDFGLERLVGEGLRVFEPAGPEIVLVSSGQVELSTAGSDTALVVDRGSAALVSHGDGRYEVRASDRRMVAWRATIGRS